MTLFERTYFIAESKLDDAVRKYGLTDPDAITFLKAVDPQMKFQNKYVDWLAKQLVDDGVWSDRNGVFEDETITFYGHSAEDIAFMLQIWNSTGKPLPVDTSFYDFFKVVSSKKTYIRKMEDSRHAKVIYKGPDYRLVWLKTARGAEALYHAKANWCIASMDYDVDDYFLSGLYVVVETHMADPWDLICLEMTGDGRLIEAWNRANTPSAVRIGNDDMLDEYGISEEDTDALWTAERRDYVNDICRKHRELFRHLRAGEGIA